MPHLFAYGTLMCEDIFRQVAGCDAARAPAVLQGFSRRQVRGEHYPALLPVDGGRVEGLVYRDLSDAAWQRLDRFEGEMYLRQEVGVELSDGTALPAFTYIVRPEYADRLEAALWEFADFLREGKERFQRHYVGYKAL
ncbi:MAG: gamma-glutamylcyclotransferase family protein [Pirellulales bacterium]